MTVMSSSFTTLALVTKIEKLSVQPRNNIKLNQQLFNTPHFVYLIAPLYRRGVLYSVYCGLDDLGHTCINVVRRFSKGKLIIKRRFR